MRISRLLSRALLIGCIACAAVPCAFGQGGGGGPGGGGGRGGFGGGGFGGGGMASLLGITEVRKELDMDEESIKDLEAASKEMRDEMMSSFGGGRGNGGGGGGTPPDMTKMRENMAAMQVKIENKLADILNPKQFDRLIGLYIQRDGTRTLSSKIISTKLEITEEQKAKIAEIENAAAEEMRTMFGGGRGGAGGGGGGGGAGGAGFADMREKMDKMRKESEEKTNGVLTAAQKAKMEELKGAKFEFPAPQPRGGGAGGRGGRGNNPQ